MYAEPSNVVAAPSSSLGFSTLQETLLPKFELEEALEAHEPPEARGLRRDEVRLMVSHYRSDDISHHRFHELAEILSEGDVIVINTSATLNASLPAMDILGRLLRVHLSTQLPGGLWVVEVRQLKGEHTLPMLHARTGDALLLPEGGHVILRRHYELRSNEQREELRQLFPPVSREQGVRLWIAEVTLPAPLHDYLERHGAPIRYSYVRQSWPLQYYQTVYAAEPGSAEMPSAGRAFSVEVMENLRSRGVIFAPLVLHTGVASLEEHEPPYAEYYRVPQETVSLIESARARGRRVIATGTTVVRALETVTDASGRLQAGEGWTERLVTPRTGIRTVDGLLTGFHEPTATHLALLQALAGSQHLKKAYAEALQARYLWHEFGDLHLLLP